MAEFKIPTEQVTLPSKGLLYPKESPLAKGEIEMKYMTAKEEDILTSHVFSFLKLEIKYGSSNCLAANAFNFKFSLSLAP